VKNRRRNGGTVVMIKTALVVLMGCICILSVSRLRRFWTFGLGALLWSRAIDF